jgi:hypothetical protein
MTFILKNLIIFKLICFILINSCIIFQIKFFFNLISIRLKGIEANYLYVYQTNFILKINHMNCFLCFIVIWNLMIQKDKWQPKKRKWYRDIWLNHLPNIHILRRNPTSRWVDFKTTHQLDGCTQNLHMHVH